MVDSNTNGAATQKNAVFKPDIDVGLALEGGPLPVVEGRPNLAQVLQHIQATHAGAVEIPVIFAGKLCVQHSKKITLGCVLDNQMPRSSSALPM
jgi:hypothetical protein